MRSTPICFSAGLARAVVTRRRHWSNTVASEFTQARVTSCGLASLLWCCSATCFRNEGFRNLEFTSQNTQLWRVQLESWFSLTYCTSTYKYELLSSSSYRKEYVLDCTAVATPHSQPRRQKQQADLLRPSFPTTHFNLHWWGEIRM